MSRVQAVPALIMEERRVLQYLAACRNDMQLSDLFKYNPDNKSSPGVVCLRTAINAMNRLWNSDPAAAATQSYQSMGLCLTISFCMTMISMWSDLNAYLPSQKNISKTSISFWGAWLTSQDYVSAKDFEGKCILCCFSHVRKRCNTNSFGLSE